MKVILWMGMSLNGYIARENNEEDFISHDCWLAWLDAVKDSKCIVWGRKTYEIVKTWPKRYLSDLKDTKIVIVSNNPNYDSGKFELAKSSL